MASPPSALGGQEITKVNACSEKGDAFRMRRDRTLELRAPQRSPWMAPCAAARAPGHPAVAAMLGTPSGSSHKERHMSPADRLSPGDLVCALPGEPERPSPDLAKAVCASAWSSLRQPPVWFLAGDATIPGPTLCSRVSISDDCHIFT